MREIAHRDHARHACAALERVQRALQRRDMRAVGAIGGEGRQRALGVLDQLAGFLRENAGDFGIIVGGERRCRRRYLDRRGCERRGLRRQARSLFGQGGGGRRLGDAVIERRLGTRDAYAVDRG